MKKVIVLGLALFASVSSAKGLFGTTINFTTTKLCKQYKCSASTSDLSKGYNLIRETTYVFSNHIYITVRTGVNTKTIYGARLDETGEPDLMHLSKAELQFVSSKFISAFTGSSDSYNAYSECLIKARENGGKYNSGLGGVFKDRSFGGNYLTCNADLDLNILEINLSSPINYKE